MLLVAIASLAIGQTRTMSMPQIEYITPIFGGQREVVLGAKPYEITLLGGFYEKDYTGGSINHGQDTQGQYVDSFIPGGIVTKSLGYLDWSTRDDKLLDTPCVTVSSSGKWQQTIGKKPNEQSWANTGKIQYWIGNDGKILRQYAQLQTPAGSQSGDLTFGPDSIQRRYTGTDGKTSFGEIFPSCGMQALNDQFKPMIVDGKVVLRDKDFFRCDPLTGGVQKYSAHISGKFTGTYLDAGFRGTTVVIVDPSGKTQTAFISDDGDLVKVKLDDDRFFVINTVPKSRLDEYGRPIHKIPDAKSGGK